MTREQAEAASELMRWAVRDNRDAALFLAHIMDIAHLADDIADGDADGPLHEHVESLLMQALVTLPANPFYQQNIGHLHPLIANAITHWSVANSIESARDVRLLDRAFILRSMYATLTVAAAQLIGGPLWAREVGKRVWAEWTAESVSSYIAEHAPPVTVSEPVEVPD